MKTLEIKELPQTLVDALEILARYAPTVERGEELFRRYAHARKNPSYGSADIHRAADCIAASNAGKEASIGKGVSIAASHANPNPESPCGTCDKYPKPLDYLI